MFFDDHKIDTEYQQLLLTIAKKQQEIFKMRFNWANKEPLLWPPKGLFGKNKKAIALYDSKVTELEELKAKTTAHRKKQGYSGGTFWWNVDWEKVLQYLICDLYEYKGNGVWRFQYEWEVEKTDNVHMLLLRENGHCSEISSNSDTIYAKESIYSESEQSAMVDAYRKAQKDSNARRIFWSDDTMVYSHRSNTLYASEADYVMSTEHWMNQQNAREKFARSLYTEHITQAVTVVSNSRHYECTMAVGGFCIGHNGILEMVHPFDYGICDSRGDVPEDIVESYQQKDPMVAIAAYLSDMPAASVIPMQLFGRDIASPAPNFYEAIRQSEIYTCLAHKLQFTD